MRRGKPRSRTPEVNLVPMIDVLMTILIFFVILTMVMGNQKKIDIALPQDPSSSPAPSVDLTKQPPAPLVVIVNPEGQLTIEGEAIADAVVLTAAKEQLDKHPEAVVILTGDAAAPYAKILSTMQLLQTFDEKRIVLALDKEPKPAAPAEQTAGADDEED
ncbi:MAG: biopolymer transporter ExbD [Cyanobacteria bacterium P01_D01_bin.73]